MANICDTEVIIRGPQEVLENLNNILDEFWSQAPLGKAIPMIDFLKYLEVESDDVRGSITYHYLDKDITTGKDMLLIDTESKWTPMDNAFKALNKSLENVLTISRRAIEPGCDLYWVCDPCDDFPEECYVIDYINGESDVMTIADAIDNWCEIVNISRDGRSDREMLNVIYGYNNETINNDKAYEIHEFKRDDDNFFNNEE